MKVVVFNSSPRSEGNTKLCLDIVMKELEKEGIEVEYIWMGMDKIQGCISCYQCAKNKDKKCGVKSDKLNDYLEKMKKERLRASESLLVSIEPKSQ